MEIKDNKKVLRPAKALQNNKQSLLNCYSTYYCTNLIEIKQSKTL